MIQSYAVRVLVVVTSTTSPNPTIIQAVSEDDETESRGHPSTAVALRPPAHVTSPSGGCGVALKALSHCPRLWGSLASRVKNNVGLGLIRWWREKSNIGSSEHPVKVTSLVGGAEATQDAVQGFVFLRIAGDTGIRLKSMTSVILGKVLK